jgi:hypothetical protein
MPEPTGLEHEGASHGSLTNEKPSFMITVASGYKVKLAHIFCPHRFAPAHHHHTCQDMALVVYIIR